MRLVRHLEEEWSAELARGVLVSSIGELMLLRLVLHVMARARRVATGSMDICGDLVGAW